MLKDRLNILGKYSWVEDKQPQDQIGDLGFEAQKAQVLSGDILTTSVPNGAQALGWRCAMVARKCVIYLGQIVKMVGCHQNGI